MTVRLQNLLPKTSFVWNDMTAGTELDVVITEPIELLQGTSGELAVRIHENDMDTSGGLTMALEAIGLCPYEPETTFVGDTLASVSLDSGDAPGTFVSSEVRWPWSGLARLKMTQSEAVGASGSGNSVTLSVDLVVCDSALGAECGCALGAAAGQGVSGLISPIFEKRSFDFSDLGASDSETVVVERAIDVSCYGDAVLEVRVHGVDFDGGDGTLKVQIREVSLTCEQPRVDFLGSTLATVTLDKDTTAETLLTAALPETFGAMFQVVVVATQPGSAHTMTATLSADLVLRSAAPPKPQTQGDFTLNSASPTLRVGDSTGSSPRVAVLSSNTGTSRIDMTNGAARSVASSLVYNHSGDYLQVASGGATELRLTSSTLRPEVSLGLDLGASSYFFGTAYLENATVGDGTGSPTVTIDKDGTGEGRLRYKNDGTTQWEVRCATNESLQLVRFSGGVAQDETTLDASDHEWSFPDDATLDSTSPTLTVGNGNGSSDVHIDKSAAGTGLVEFLTDSTTQWTVGQDTVEKFKISRYSGGTLEDYDIQVNSDDEGTVKTRGLHYTFHAYNRTDTNKCYVPWDTSTEALTLPSTLHHVIARASGRLYTVRLKCDSSVGAGVTTVGFHKNDSNTPSATVSQTVGANTVVEFDFSSESSTFAKGDMLSVSVKPTSPPANVNVTNTWRFNETDGVIG